MVDSFPSGAAPAEWVSVFRSPTRRPCEEQALVLKAMNLEHLVAEGLDGCHVLVPAREAPAALEQLRLYRRENPGGRAPAWPDVPPGRGLAAGGAFALVVAASFVVQARYALGIDWLSAGELVAGAVREGEWWRAFTALTLHGEVAHVAGNVAFGAFFGYLAGQYLGSGVAALAIVWMAGLGNFANAWLQAAWHRSIGASTAVFAALGLVAAFVWGISRGHTLGWARRWSPVVGAVALLAYTGTGDAQTDVVAHLTGFLAGAAGGALVYAVPALAKPRFATQAVAAAAAALTLALAWLRALAAT